MYTMDVALTVSFLATLLLLVRRIQRRSDELILDVCFGSFLFFVGFCLIGALIGLDLNGHLPYKIVSKGPFTLVAMRSADGVTGSFVYGTGIINGVAMYRVMVRNDDGSLTPYQVIADSSVRIIESSDMHNEGKWNITEVLKDYSSPLAKWAIGPDFVTDSNTLTVPVGTVVQEFTVK